MKKQSFNLSKVEGIPSPRGRFQLKKLTFPSPTVFFSRRGSDCRRGTSRTSTGEVRVGAGQKSAFTLAEVLITLGVIKSSTFIIKINFIIQKGNKFIMI